MFGWGLYKPGVGIVTRLALALFLLAMPAVALAEPPPAPVPPPEAERLVQHTTRWLATCEIDEASYPCWQYTVTRYVTDDCSRADTNGDGRVGTSDFILLAQQWGCQAEEDDDE